MGAHRRLTLAELNAEARERFGDDPKTYAFVCPSCGDVASIQDFLDATGDASAAGQECIGRSPGARRGCSFVAYGLIPGPWEIVMPAEGDKPERTARSFALAEDGTR